MSTGASMTMTMTTTTSEAMDARILTLKYIQPAMGTPRSEAGRRNPHDNKAFEQRDASDYWGALGNNQGELATLP